MLKIFSHRGLVDEGFKENSLEAFYNAYKNGFKAIEFDIWYLENQLFLHHDFPKDLTNLNKLEDLFLKFQNEIEYWLDFKNLDAKNCEDAIKAVKKIIDNLKINPKQLYFAPFITDFEKALEIYKIIRKYFGNDVQIVAVVEKLTKENYHNFYQQLKEANIYGLSIQYKNINLEFKNIFHDIKIFAWTINDQQTADLLDKIGIENIASDKLKPQKKPI